MRSARKQPVIDLGNDREFMLIVVFMAIVFFWGIIDANAEGGLAAPSTPAPYSIPPSRPRARAILHKSILTGTTAEKESPIDRTVIPPPNVHRDCLCTIPYTVKSPKSRIRSKLSRIISTHLD